MHLITDPLAPPMPLIDDESLIGDALDGLPLGTPAIIAGDSETDLAHTIRRLASYRSIAVRFVAPLLDGPPPPLRLPEPDPIPEEVAD